MSSGPAFAHRPDVTARVRALENAQAATPVRTLKDAHAAVPVFSFDGAAAAPLVGSTTRASAASALGAAFPERTGDALVAVGAVAALAPAAGLFGIELRAGLTATLAAGAGLARLAPEAARGIAALTGLAVLAQWTALRFAAYEALLLVALYASRRRAPLFFALLILGTIVIPKELFRRHYHDAFAHDWIASFLLTQILLVALLWWRERGRPEARIDGLHEWLSLFVFPSQPVNPLVLGPAELGGAPRFEARGVFGSVALVAAKGAAVVLIDRLAPELALRRHDAASLAALSWPELWAVAFVTYVSYTLTLSGTSDVTIAIARAFGWPLRHPFRFALLAWNPVELWRRWALYNRKLLVKLVYLPLGGGKRRRLLNVMATFAASGLVLHTGWFGSKYWECGIGGWRDQTVYFLLQGAAVCACLSLWRLIGKSSDADRHLRLSGLRVLATIGTQALSALVHVLVLAPSVAWADRFRIMGRLLGLG